MWICACNYLLRVALYPFLCLYSNWNYSNLLDRQFCFNHKVWFHFAFYHCLVFNGNLIYYFNNNKFFCKLKNGVWGLLCNLFKGLQSVCYATALTSSPGPIKLGSDLRGDISSQRLSPPILSLCAHRGFSCFSFVVESILPSNKPCRVGEWFRCILPQGDYQHHWTELHAPNNFTQPTQPNPTAGVTRGFWD